MKPKAALKSANLKLLTMASRPSAALQPGSWARAPPRRIFRRRAAIGQKLSPVALARSASAWASLSTLIAVMPSWAAGLQFTPRSSR